LTAIPLSTAPAVHPAWSSTSGSTGIAIAGLRSFVFVVTATLLILVALPAALVAAGG
jgi:hypothetical protein